MAFYHCNRSDWTAAERVLTSISSDKEQSLQVACDQSFLYLDAMVKQGTGRTDAALAAYRRPELSLPVGPTKLSGSDLDFRILSALNSIALLRAVESTTAEAEDLLVKTKSLCKDHANQNIVTAYNLLCATTKSDLPIINAKNHIQTALNIAKRLSNHQLLSLAMNIMVSRFFTGIVGEQAESSAKSCYTLAKRSHSPLITAAAAGMLSRTLDLCGKKEQAEKARAQATRLVGSLPDAVKGNF